MNLTGSEDCLYLNVYTPKTYFYDLNRNLKPVMIWIYGGSFKSGYSNSSLYGPDFIIEQGIVLVTFNYRLGPLGFLSLNHPAATGNAGLKDQNLVLKWVRRNIAKFGGDPDNVTLFGQSAGGAAVEYHMVSDMSQGLFHRTISMSASILSSWAFHSPTHATKRAFKLGNVLGIAATTKEDLLRTLYKIPAYELVTASEKVSKVGPAFKPTLENFRVSSKSQIFLSECSLRKFVAGNFSKVPHMMGFTAYETILFATENAKETLRSVLSYFGPLPSKLFPNSKYLLDPKNSNAVLSDPTIMSLINETSDIFFIAGIDAKQRLLNAYGSRPVYYYRLSFDTKYSLHRLYYNIDLDGTAHGDDIAYLFYTTLTDIPFSKEKRLSVTRDRIVRMWTNFAKYGDPTPRGTDDSLLNVFWPGSGSSGIHLEIGDELSVGPRPINLRVRLYELGTKVPVQNGCIFPFLLS
ncbi:cholinesterase 1 isoform X2 [Cephus cinctus]|nr:cholinesterase 1 isoform X2 [Cephus cinctus]